MGTPWREAATGRSGRRRAAGRPVAPSAPPSTRRLSAGLVGVPLVGVPLVGVALLAACGVEYRPAKTGAESARAVAAHAESLAVQGAGGGRDTVVRIDTVVRVDTVLVRDTLPALGDPPPDVAAAAPAPAPASPVDSFRVTPRPDPAGPGRDLAAPTASVPAASPAPAAPPVVTPVVTPADLATLRAAGLRVPVQGIPAARVPDTFGERRDGGSLPHEALDIAAPRGTPVLAAAGGRVHKLFTSAAGGLTVYVLDPAGRFVYYYAHLDAYRPGIAEGQAVRAGDVLGTVGSTGNASPAAPHLHFAVARLDDPRRWWEGTPLDPRPFLR